MNTLWRLPSFAVVMPMEGNVYSTMSQDRRYIIDKHTRPTNLGGDEVRNLGVGLHAEFDDRREFRIVGRIVKGCRNHGDRYERLHDGRVEVARPSTDYLGSRLD